MKIVQPITINDTSLLASNVPENEVQYVSNKVYKLGDQVRGIGDNNHKMYEARTGSTSTVTLSIASPCVVSWAANGRAEGDPVSISTTGTLPTGVVANTVYYVRLISGNVNGFNISATPTGPLITTTGTQTGVHTATSSQAYNKEPSANPDVWLDIGATNRYKMFDQSVQSQTTNPEAITVSIKAATYIDNVTLLNIKGQSVHIKAEHPTDGVVYEKTKSLISYIGVVNLWKYFFTPIEKPTDVVFNDIPLYAGLTITVTVFFTGNSAAVGCIIVGLSRDISYTKLGAEQGARVTIDDYSIKERDSFGNYTIVERAFNKRADFTVYINTKEVDDVQKLLTRRRAQPTLYIGCEEYAATIVYGFFKTFDIEMTDRDTSICTIQLEGLT